MENTSKFYKPNPPNVFTANEHDLVVKANLLEFLHELNAIDFEVWEEAHMPLESLRMSFIQLRGDRF
jgi:hypothetical protein